MFAAPPRPCPRTRPCRVLEAEQRLRGAAVHADEQVGAVLGRAHAAPIRGAPAALLLSKECSISSSVLPLVSGRTKAEIRK